MECNVKFYFPVLREKCLLIPSYNAGYINRKKIKCLNIVLESSLCHSHCCDCIPYRNIERTNKFVCTL